MATWSEAAKKAWAKGMKSENQNALNSTQQVELKKKVDKWADGTKNNSEASKQFPVGKVKDVEMVVLVTAKNAEVTEVKFGEITKLRGG